MATKICKNCKHFNDFEHTYVKADNCCSYWHIAYRYWENKGNKPACKEFKDKNALVQLNLFKYE